MNFMLSEDEKMFQDNFRKFVQREIAPLVGDAEEKHRFPVELFPKLGKLGYLGIRFPEKYGGANANMLTECIWEEEMARVNVGISTSIGLGSAIAFHAINEFGTEEQKRKFLLPGNQGRLIGAIAITEPNAGSDVAGIQTNAKKDGEFYILNGSKMWITNATIANVIVVIAYTDRDKGPDAGISMLIVEKETPGLTSKSIKKMSSKSADTGEINFENCIIPKENLLGKEGMGLRNFSDAFLGGRLLNAARSLGNSEACFEIAKKYALERIQFGKPICKFQAIRFKLASMAVELGLVRTYVWQAARMYEAGRLSRKIASTAKLYASEMAQRVAAEAMQIHGAYGISEEYDIERRFRDARTMTVGEGTSEIQRMIVAHEIGL
ncbi:MAG: acyl-CoA dehydrogenase family protein [Syntrophales bacterium]|nr:acyl-CoA dehydrogenase family protein [Syntrophales bacterium]